MRSRAALVGASSPRATSESSTFCIAVVRSGRRADRPVADRDVEGVRWPRSGRWPTGSARSASTRRGTRRTTRLAVSAAVGKHRPPVAGADAAGDPRRARGRRARRRRPAAIRPRSRPRCVARSMRAGGLRDRPGSGAAGANAVVFRDLTELLAHYLVDLTTGRARERWWWGALHRQLAPTGRVADVLAEHIWFAPQVLAEVQRLGRLREVAAALDAESCERLTAQLAEVHAAPALNAALTRALHPTAIRPPRPQTRRRSAAKCGTGLPASMAERVGCSSPPRSSSPPTRWWPARRPSPAGSRRWPSSGATGRFTLDQPRLGRRAIGRRRPARRPVPSPTNAAPEPVRRVRAVRAARAGERSGDASRTRPRRSTRPPRWTRPRRQ